MRVPAGISTRSGCGGGGGGGAAAATGWSRGAAREASPVRFTDESMLSIVCTRMGVPAAISTRFGCGGGGGGGAAAATGWSGGADGAEGGEVFHAALASPIVVDDQIVIPAATD